MWTRGAQESAQEKQCENGSKVFSGMRHKSFLLTDYFYMHIELYTSIYRLMYIYI